jgi:hypothetical protein
LTGNLIDELPGPRPGCILETSSYFLFFTKKESIKDQISKFNLSLWQYWHTVKATKRCLQNKVCGGKSIKTIKCTFSSI